MFQDELPDYYFYHHAKRREEQQLHEAEAAKAGDEDEPFDPGILSALCQGQKMPIPYHQNAINPKEALRVERRRKGLKNKGRRLIHDLTTDLRTIKEEEFWRKDV